MVIVSCLKPLDAPCAVRPCCVLKRALEKARDAFIGVLVSYNMSDLVQPRGRFVNLLVFRRSRPSGNCHTCFALSHSCDFCELVLQFAAFFEIFGHIAKDCRCSDRTVLLVLQHNNREPDRDSSTALGQRWHRQEVAPAVVTFARLHDAIEPGPMARLEIGGNDEIERASMASSAVKPKNPVGAWIPEINGSCAAGSDDRV